MNIADQQTEIRALYCRMAKDSRRAFLSWLVDLHIDEKLDAAQAAQARARCIEKGRRYELKRKRERNDRNGN